MKIKQEVYYFIKFFFSYFVFILIVYFVFKNMFYKNVLSENLFDTCLIINEILFLLIIIYKNKIFKTYFDLINIKINIKWIKYCIFETLLIISVYFMSCFLNWYNSNYNTNYSSLYFLISFSLWIFYAIPEELMRIIMLKFYFTNNISSILLSSLFFSLLHIFNSNYNIMSFLILFFSGIILAYILIEFKIYITIFLHAWWNFINYNLGLPVSGEYLFTNFNLQPITTTIIIKENIFNGGKFGVEASIIVLIFLIFISLLYTSLINDFKTFISEIKSSPHAPPHNLSRKH